ncbi:hypothetical protein Tco_0978893 [Tanacetum coccineum]|uniref:DUF4218 domain-containing protein n=1 Tax=Tanacetum coccineum TaxID=301880 RepID=A0ABQ5EP96_9ASTR
MFCQFIKGVKLPDGFGSNFKHKVTDNDTNITGLKSHDCHIMMQRLLPYRLQQYLPGDVAKPIIELCLFFKQICFQTLMEDDMLKAQSKVVDILCNLELIYPLGFFDIMIHLVIHLPLEALVIQNGNSKKRISSGKDGVVRILPPVSATKIHVVEKERKARTILLMAIPQRNHLKDFHGMMMQRNLEAIWTSLEGLEKGYDRFQQLLSQLEAHGAEVSTKDANHKFLRSLPPAWSNLAMTMRTKPDVDTLSIDELYNNLRVFEKEVPVDLLVEVIYSLLAKQSEDFGLAFQQEPRNRI